MTRLSLFERFQTIVSGVFDLTAIVYYLTVIVFFLFLSVRSLEKRRRGRISGSMVWMSRSVPFRWRQRLKITKFY